MSTFHITPGFAPADRARVAALYWAAFSAKLGPLMGPTPKAQRFFEAALDPAFAISATDTDGTLLGVAGYKTASGGLAGGGLRDLARVYGWAGTLWRAPFLAMLERDLAPDVLLMDGIFVAPEARGRGVGTALLTAIKHKAAALDLADVRLDVIDTNPRARALYEREGFVAGETASVGPLKALFGFQYSTTMRYTCPTP